MEEPRELHAYEGQFAKDLQGHEAFAEHPELNDLARDYINLREFKKQSGNMVKIPDENSTEEERAAYYKARGIPSSPADYKIEVKLPEGVKKNEALESGIRTLAANARLEPAQAQGVADWIGQLVGGLGQANKQKQEKVVEELKSVLGEEGMASAEKALAKYGGEEYAKQVFSDPGSHAGTIKAFAEVAKAISEDTLPSDTTGGVKSPEEMTWEDRFPDMKRVNGKIVEVRHG
jgi:hypothetical protein